MASIAIMVGAAIVNAVAFTAGNALYDKFGRGDGSEERVGMIKLLRIYKKLVQNGARKEQQH